MPFAVRALCFALAAHILSFLSYFFYNYEGNCFADWSALCDFHAVAFFDVYAWWIV
jgi:hypothetical protein